MGDLCPSRSSSSQCSGSWSVCFRVFWIHFRIRNLFVWIRILPSTFLLFCHFFWLFILNDVNVQKGLSIKIKNWKNIIFVGILKVIDEKNRIRSQIRIRFRSVSQCTDPRIRILIWVRTRMSLSTDPEHWFQPSKIDANLYGSGSTALIFLFVL